MGLQPRYAVRIIRPQPVLEGAGVRLRRSIATRILDYLDPFLLFDHFGSDDPVDYLAGFPMHPHRGIETVTYMLAGAVKHRDSMGNAGTIGAGDVQWMTAGRGILHEEMPKPVQGQMAGFQLWVNLPARLKMMQPHYQEIASSHIPEVSREGGAQIRVIAGQVDAVRGPITGIAADPTYLDITLAPQGIFRQPVPRDHNAFVYLFEGEAALLAGEAYPAGVEHAPALRASGGKAAGTALRHPVYVQDALIVLSDGDLVQVRTAHRPARFLLVSGHPLHEPIARYGPFVMNTRQEIEQTLRDLRDGTFIRP